MARVATNAKHGGIRGMFLQAWIPTKFNFPSSDLARHWLAQLHCPCGMREERRNLRPFVLSSGSSVPLLSPEISFKKWRGDSLMQADRSSQDIIGLLFGATATAPCPNHTPCPAIWFYFKSFLQRALDEGQFVWMFNAVALAGGGLYEMAPWFVAAGIGLE